MMRRMRTGPRTWMTLLAGFLLGCSQDTFASATDAAPDGTNDGTTGGDSAVDSAPDAAIDCGDSLSDPQNCGACAHSCLGGDCDAGTCMPVVLAKNATPPGFVAVDDHGVYWTLPDADGGVMRIDKDGGSRAPLVSHVGALAITVHEGVVYYAGSIYLGMVPTDGGAPVTTLAPVFTDDIAADATRVFSTSEGTTSIVMSHDLLLASSVETGNQGGGLGGIAVDATHVYFAISSGTIRSLNKTTLDVASSLPGQLSPEGVAVDENFVFWTNNGNGTVQRAATNLAASVPIATTQNSPHRLALDKKNVYWANGGGTIMKVDKLGAAPPVFLFTGPGGPRGIAVDAEAIYWTNESNNTVMKLAKPAD